MNFPTEIIEQIVVETRDLRIADIFKNYISEYIYDRMEQYILIEGNVQSGKTNEIVNYINNENHKYKVLVLQNSKLVLKQYITRFKNVNIRFQVITKHTKSIKENLIILINNAQRYNHFQRLNQNKPYILMIDEADMCINSCPLRGYKNVHITATPYNFKRKHLVEYDRVIRVPKNVDYYNFDQMQTIVNDNTAEAIFEFLGTDNGMLLINRFSSITTMNTIADHMSNLFTISSFNIPIVVLTSVKKYYLNGECVRLPQNVSISHIIDKFKDYKHVVFIANRLASRGVSFVSSDYSRHLTHQITRIKTSMANFVQGVRLLGVYKDKPVLRLYITSECALRYSVYISDINSDINNEVS